MVDDLDAACHQSLDPPQASTPPVVQLVHSGHRGRPRIHIDPQFLEIALGLRGPTGIAASLGVSSRSVRRRALDLHLVEPGPPVHHTVDTPEGPVQVHTSSTAPFTDITDDDLDAVIAGVLTVFPTFGRRMIDGNLKARGLNIPRDRIQASYSRVFGAPATFGNRQIVRKEYRVPGPLSLAHMDGQHGTLLAPFASMSLISSRSHSIQNCDPLHHRRLFPLHTRDRRP